MPYSVDQTLRRTDSEPIQTLTNFKIKKPFLPQLVSDSLPLAGGAWYDILTILVTSSWRLPGPFHVVSLTLFHSFTRCTWQFCLFTVNSETKRTVAASTERAGTSTAGGYLTASYPRYFRLMPFTLWTFWFSLENCCMLQLGYLRVSSAAGALDRHTRSRFF